MAMIVVALLTVFDIYDRHRTHAEDTSKWTDIDKLEQVPSRVFRSETVVVDGKYFLSPTFDHVMFVYNGTAGVAMDDVHFGRTSPGERAFQIGSRNNAVKTTLKLETLLFASVGCRTGIDNLGNAYIEGATPPNPQP